MKSYPSINWWSGNLRAYESKTSFFARFCELNGVSLKTCCEFLGVGWNHYISLTSADLKRIAFLLNEDLRLVKTVFVPTVSLKQCGHYGLPWSEFNSQSVQYCKECAKQGYHSYLHEVKWLAKCPFHETDLNTCYPPRRVGTVDAQRMAALKHIMRSSFREWPNAIDGCFTIHEQGRFRRLAAWTRSVSDAATRSSHSEIWDSDEFPYNSAASLAQVIGQLRTFVPMPKVIKPLFTEIGETWHTEIRRFPLAAKSELARLKSRLRFGSIFDFYISVSARSANPPPYIKQLRAYQNAIRVRHGACHCRWGRMRDSWYYNWMQVAPDEWPHWACICPYDVALQDLERGWGRADLVLSDRKLRKELMFFMMRSRDMRDAGLISYTPDAHVTPDGCLCMYSQIWPCCEWAPDSPLTDLLNTVAEFEIESAFNGLITWLDNIEHGIDPRQCDDPINYARLSETEEGLLLINWTRSGPGNEI